MESILGNSRKPDISFFRDGHIDITARVAKSLSLSEGDIIDILRSDREFYIYVKTRNQDVVGQHAGRCRTTRPNSYCNFRTNCKKLTDAILAECNEAEVVRLAAGETMEMPNLGVVIPLITRIKL
jgi:hypothetical protein